MVLSSIGCNKSSPLGSDILPIDDFAIIGYSDTVPLISSIVRGDSQQVYNPQQAFQLRHHLCGITNDPVFGKVTSEVYNQFILSRTSPDFSNIQSLDSLVFRVALNSDSTFYSGNIGAPQTFHLYELDESLDRLSTYYSDQSFAKKRLIATTTVVPDFTNQTLSVILDDTTRFAPNISFKIDGLVAAGLLADAIDDPTILEKNGDFQIYFKGVAIVPDPSNTMMARFDYESGTTGMVMYYREMIDTVEIYNKLVFAINSITAKTTHFEHDFTGSAVAAALDGTAPNPDELIYIEGMQGPNAKISFPDVSHLENIIVNNAQLELTVVDNILDTLQFPIPHFLFASQLIDGEGFQALVDAFGAGNPLQGFEGYPRYVLDDNGTVYRRYVLNISKHFQSIVDGTVDYPDIYLSVLGKAETSNRVILGGSNHPDPNIKAKLKLTYTQL